MIRGESLLVHVFHSLAHIDIKVQVVVAFEGRLSRWVDWYGLSAFEVAQLLIHLLLLTLQFLKYLLLQVAIPILG